jgi:hypothetical protein
MTELKGKKIAFPGEGSQQYPLLLKALSDAGSSRRMTWSSSKPMAHRYRRYL